MLALSKPLEAFTNPIQGGKCGRWWYGMGVGGSLRVSAVQQVSKQGTESGQIFASLAILQTDLLLQIYLA
jgi:hypothetical protein